MATLHPPTPSAVARRFFAVAVIVFCAGGALAEALIALDERLRFSGPRNFPPAFLLSTLLLGTGSWLLQRALRHVRIERQRIFRRSLLWGLVVGTAFVGVQSLALWQYVRGTDPAEASTGAGVFVFALAALHGLHFSVALLFLAFVTVRAWADRYDHEYYWGVMVCTVFWHFLGVVWLVIFGVLVFTS